jgi:hypothetical protein
MDQPGYIPPPSLDFLDHTTIRHTFIPESRRYWKVFGLICLILLMLGGGVAAYTWYASRPPALVPESIEQPSQASKVSAPVSTDDQITQAASETESMLETLERDLEKLDTVLTDTPTNLDY